MVSGEKQAGKGNFHTLVICTHNRVNTLGAVIEALLKCNGLVATAAEIIVVDNNSSDETPAVVDRLVQSHAAVRYLKEERLGLSHARNAGLQAARGEFVTYLDDDLLIPHDWFLELAAFWRDAGEKCGGMGGRVLPFWESKRPAWLIEGLWGYLSVCDRGVGARRLQRGETLVGANMAFRRSALQQVGGFSSGLGRVGSKLLSNEELLVQNQLEAGGWELWYNGRVCVEHIIPAERMTWTWFKRRFYWQGVSHGTMIGIEDVGQGRIRQLCLRLARVGLRLPAKTILFLWRFVVDRRSVHRLGWYSAVGTCYGFAHALLGAGSVRRFPAQIIKAK